MHALLAMAACHGFKDSPRVDVSKGAALNGEFEAGEVILHAPYLLGST